MYVYIYTHTYTHTRVFTRMHLFVFMLASKFRKDSTPLGSVVVRECVEAYKGKKKSACCNFHEFRKDSTPLRGVIVRGYVTTYHHNQIRGCHKEKGKKLWVCRMFSEFLQI